VNYQPYRHQPGEDTVRGMVYRNEVGYTGPKTFQKNALQDPSIKTIDTCLVQTNVLHKKGAGRPVASGENIESICEVFVLSPHKST
jgi:hypothetical protein